MVLATLLLGALAFYYFGLRAAGWAATVTLLLCLLALVVPSLALAIHVSIAAAAIALWRIGSRRQRPPDAVIAVLLVRRGLARAWSLVRAAARRLFP
jgi:hypothetical protein